MDASTNVGAQSGAVLRLVLNGASTAVFRADATRVPLPRLDAALLAVLALEGATSRQRLMQLLCPDDEPENARNVLRQRLFRLRRVVGDRLVVGAERLSLAAGVEHDVEGSDGELLAAHDYAECPEFERWLDERRRGLAAQRHTRDALAIDACEREGRYAEGAMLAERLVAADALDETAVRRLMKLRYLDGQRGAAIAAFDRFAVAQAQDRGGEPSLATRELADTIRASRAPLPLARREIPASVLRPPWLIGREGERGRLRTAWSADRMFWLFGEAGLGKTRLLTEFVAEASGANGAEALVVAARPGDAGVPYASLARALRALLERRPQLMERAQRGELARVMPEIDLAGVKLGLGQHMALQRAVEALLREAQCAGLTSIVFDDLHFADSASLEMLQALLLADAPAKLNWGFAQRPAEGALAAEALRFALEEVQRVESVALSPLDAAQIAELLGSLELPGIDTAALAPQLARHTGGNPMYVLETIKHLVAGDAGAIDAKLPSPASVSQLIERRLRQLTPQALALARVAAVAGVDFSIEMAIAVLDCRALALADAWNELEAAQVLRGDAFAHDLVHDATLAGVPGPIAAHTHGAVAAWLEEHGGEPARIAAHWLATTQPQRASAALHAAAAAAGRAMRRKEEAGFLKRVAQIEAEAGDHGAAFASWRAMIEALWISDRRTLDAAAYDQLAAWATTPQQRGVALAVRATWAQDVGEIEAAQRLCEAAIDLADAAGDAPTAADARQRLAQILQFKGDFEAALMLMQQLQPWFAGRADGERGAFYGDLAIVLDNADRGREARVYHQRAIELSRKAGIWSDVVTELGNLAVNWETAGYMERAIAVLQEALQLAAAHDEARGCAATLPIEMHNALRDSGRYAEALRWVEPALAAVEGQMAAWKPLVQCHVACGWIHLGQHARAQREIDAALKADAPAWMRAKALQMSARLRIATGQGAKELLAQAHDATMVNDGRRSLRASIVLDHALALDPPAALAVAHGVIAEAERLDLPGMALAGRIRAMRFAADAGLAAEAAAHAQAALAIGDDVTPNDLYPGERWLNAWHALRCAGRGAEANEVLGRGVAWVKQTQQTQVPEPFRSSFGRANAVNLQLLRAGSIT